MVPKAYSLRINVKNFFDVYHLSKWIEWSIEIAENFSEPYYFHIRGAWVWTNPNCDSPISLNRIKRRLNQQDDVSLYIKIKS